MAKRYVIKQAELGELSGFSRLLSASSDGIVMTMGRRIGFITSDVYNLRDKQKRFAKILNRARRRSKRRAKKASAK